MLPDAGASLAMPQDCQFAKRVAFAQPWAPSTTKHHGLPNLTSPHSDLLLLLSKRRRSSDCPSLPSALAPPILAKGVAARTYSGWTVMLAVGRERRLKLRQCSDIAFLTNTATRCGCGSPPQPPSTPHRAVPSPSAAPVESVRWNRLQSCRGTAARRRPRTVGQSARCEVRAGRAAWRRWRRPKLPAPTKHGRDSATALYCTARRRLPGARPVSNQRAQPAATGSRAEGCAREPRAFAGRGGVGQQGQQQQQQQAGGAQWAQWQDLRRHRVTGRQCDCRP